MLSKYIIVSKENIMDPIGLYNIYTLIDFNVKLGLMKWDSNNTAI